MQNIEITLTHPEAESLQAALRFYLNSDHNDVAGVTDVTKLYNLLADKLWVSDLLSQE